MKSKFTSTTLLYIVLLLTTSSLLGQVRQKFDVRMPMRDGAELSADIWLPEKEGKYPAILVRTPYTKVDRQPRFPDFGKFFAERGYVFILQDVRGRGDSDGEFNFFFSDGNDGYDAIEWIAQQEWCNGKVGTSGPSYMGGAQWVAARERPPHLVCMLSTAPAGNYFDAFIYHQGAWGSSWLTWLNITSARTFQTNFFGMDMNKIMQHRPLITMDSAMGREMRLYREWLTHSTLDEYWKPLILTKKDYKNIDLPVLHVTGWFDVGLIGMQKYWENMNRYSPAKDKQYILIGPWDHTQTWVGGGTKIGEMEFTDESIIDTKELHLAFFEHYLKGTGPEFNHPNAKIYVTGINVWREFDEFPPAQVENTPLYLHSGGEANTIDGDGELAWNKPMKENPDTFTYDPQNPVRANYGYAVDCREVEERQDVLVYTTEVLEEPIEIIGETSVNLYASSDALDTDFTARLLDVYPDGRAVNLGAETVGGIIRARYRNGYEKEEFLESNKPELFNIKLFYMGHTFLAGHKIRVEISSSATPDYFPNQNTGNPVATDTEWKIANQTIYHDKTRPSHIVLPIMKNNE